MHCAQGNCTVREGPQVIGNLSCQDSTSNNIFSHKNKLRDSHAIEVML